MAERCKKHGTLKVCLKCTQEKRARAHKKKYSAEQMREWGKMGGRPKKKAGD